MKSLFPVLILIIFGTNIANSKSYSDFLNIKAVISNDLETHSNDSTDKQKTEKQKKSDH